MKRGGGERPRIWHEAIAGVPENSVAKSHSLELGVVRFVKKGVEASISKYRVVCF
jgi:hypothetical protein